MVFSVRDDAESGLQSSDGTGDLLVPEDGPPVEVVNPQGAAKILLVCEHASNRIPRALGSLGLGPAALESHIAWDPGAAAVARGLAERLDAALVLQRFSRLVQDCNRAVDAEDAMPARSEAFDVPGNRDLSAAARRARSAAVYDPFHAQIGALLDRGRAAALVTVHSFVPSYLGRPRKVELGILHDSDARLADSLLAQTADCEFDLRRNEPYGPEQGVTHTLARHAIPRGLLNVMIEIRSDLIADRNSQSAMAERLAGWLARALDETG